jgi:hypothetical protein
MNLLRKQSAKTPFGKRSLISVQSQNESRPSCPATLDIFWNIFSSPNDVNDNRFAPRL